MRPVDAAGRAYAMTDTKSGGTDHAAVMQMLCRNCLRSGHVGGGALDACPFCDSDDVRMAGEMFTLTIAHIDCDAFFASVEKRDNPDIRERPVIVGGGRRGVVSAACYIARRYGVRSALPMWQALKKCPEAVVVRPRMDRYVEVSREIRERMFALTPLVQPLSIDEAFLDLGGTEKLHGSPPALALVRLQREIREQMGLTVSVGLSGTKSLAKMASDRDKPDGFFVIDMQGAAAWLAPQPVGVLYGLGKAAQARLAAAGITTCAQMAAAEPAKARSLLGRNAHTIQQLARAVDPRRVELEREAKSISAETTFETDLGGAAELEAELERLCLKVSSRLKAAELAGGRVTLKLKRHDHTLLTRSLTLDDPTSRTHRLFAVGRELLLREIGGNRRYRLIGIGADQLGPPQPGGLLEIADETAIRKNQLEAAIDDLHGRMGTGALQSGRQFARTGAARKGADDGGRDGRRTGSPGRTRDENGDDNG